MRVLLPARCLALTASVLAFPLSAQQAPGAYDDVLPGCAGSNGTPTLDRCLGTSPLTGANFCVEVSNLPPVAGQPVSLMTGFTPLPFPIPLDGFGVPGCALGVAPTVVSPLMRLPTDLSTARLTIAIPDDASLFGLRLFQQAFVVDPATSNGVSFSNVRAGTVGGRQSREFVETFADNSQIDDVSSVRPSSFGALAPAIGGDGKHGAFDLSVFTQVGLFDYEWDTGVPVVVPASRTLLGEGPLVIENGEAEFTRFELPAGITFRIFGPHAPVIRVTGPTVIRGELDASGFVQTPPVSESLGGAGGVGGPGGATGGRGADAFVPSFPSAPTFAVPDETHQGRPGGNLQLNGTSVFESMVDGTGGNGAGTFPASGLLSDVSTSVLSLFSGQQLSGGGGGGYFLPGGDGEVTDILTPLAPEIGPIAAAGQEVEMQFPGGPLLLISERNLRTYLIGGSGGGGGGSVSTLVRPSILVASFLRFTNGAGGGGGGGALAFRTGGNFTMAPGSFIHVDGGIGAGSIGNTWLSRGTSASGGGSGGTVLLQTNGQRTMNGSITALGGTGGVYETTSVDGVLGRSVGGTGAQGHVHFEPLEFTPGTILANTTCSQLTDRDARSLLRSKWLELEGDFTPNLRSYEVQATVNGTPRVYTDDPDLPSPADVDGEPVRVLLQAAVLDTATGEPLTTGPWVDSVSELQLPGTNAVRYLIFLDFTNSLSVGLSVQRFTLRYDA